MLTQVRKSAHKSCKEVREYKGFNSTVKVFDDVIGEKMIIVKHDKCEELLAPQMKVDLKHDTISFNMPTGTFDKKEMNEIKDSINDMLALTEEIEKKKKEL